MFAGFLPFVTIAEPAIDLSKLSKISWDDFVRQYPEVKCAPVIGYDHPRYRCVAPELALGGQRNWNALWVFSRGRLLDFQASLKTRDSAHYDAVKVVLNKGLMTKSVSYVNDYYLAKTQRNVGDWKMSRGDRLSTATYRESRWTSVQGEFALKEEIDMTGGVPESPSIVELTLRFDASTR